MLAYHSKPAVKTDILAQLQQHRAADQIVQGYGYWKGGRGCAVGCTLHSGRHEEYETRFGIPVHLAYLEDRLFEGMPVEKAREWPMRFMGAIRPGADLSGVWRTFMVFLLTSEQWGVLRHAKTEEQRSIIQEVAALFERGETNKKVWRDVRDRAWRVHADAAAYAATAAGDALTRAASGESAPQAAASAVRRQHYEAQADKLIELLEAA